MPYGCASTAASERLSATKSDEPQHINQVMQSAPLLGRSVVQYAKVLNAGDIVNGYIMITGLWEIELDYATPWTFEAWSPDGVMLDNATINYDIDPYHAFKFTANTRGKYLLRAIHISLSTRDLDIFVSPTGWEFDKAYVE